MNLEGSTKTNTICNSISSNSPEVVSSTMDVSSSTLSPVLEPIISKVVEQPLVSNEPILLFIKKVDFEIKNFIHTLYQDDDPLFMFSEVNSYFDQVFFHYQNVLTLMNSKICLLGGFSIENSTGGIDALASSLNFQFHHLTLVFISYCQGVVLFHQNNPTFVSAIENFLKLFINTDFLCIRITDPTAILIDISAYLPILHRADTQEVLNSYINLLNAYGLMNLTVSQSIFQCTILTLHSLNDLALNFLNDLTILSLEVSAIVPLGL